MALATRSRERWAEASPLCDYGLALRAELPDDGILVNESTQVGYWNAGGGFPVYEPRTFLGYGYQGTLGYGFPTALGAQVGNPDRKVISVNGDGGFLFNVQELSTMAQHRIPVVAVVFDDRAYGNVRRIQQLRMGGHTIASELLNPDWIKLAESFGVAGYRAEDPAALREVLRKALASDAPALIAVPMPDAAAISGFYPPEPLPPAPSLHRGTFLAFLHWGTFLRSWRSQERKNVPLCKARRRWLQNKEESPGGTPVLVLRDRGDDGTAGGVHSPRAHEDREAP